MHVPLILLATDVVHPRVCAIRKLAHVASVLVYRQRNSVSERMLSTCFSAQQACQIAYACHGDLHVLNRTVNHTLSTGSSDARALPETPDARFNIFQTVHKLLSHGPLSRRDWGRVEEFGEVVPEWIHANLLRLVRHPRCDQASACSVTHMETICDAADVLCTGDILSTTFPPSPWQAAVAMHWTTRSIHRLREFQAPTPPITKSEYPPGSRIFRAYQMRVMRSALMSRITSQGTSFVTSQATSFVTSDVTSDVTSRVKRVSSVQHVKSTKRIKLFGPQARRKRA